MKNYLVYDGTYPFKDIIGTVTVPPHDDKEVEASMALNAAIQEFGGHPVVEPGQQVVH